MTVSLYVGDIQLPDDCRRNLKQTITPLRVGSSPRLANGGKIYRGIWQGKLSTVITGSGFAPPGLSGIDFTQPVLIKCIQPVEYGAVGNVVTLPVGFRSDVPLEGYATLNSDLVETAITNESGNVITLSAVAGATNHRVRCWPEFYVIDAQYEESIDAETKIWSWSLTAEEQ